MAATRSAEILAPAFGQWGAIAVSHQFFGEPPGGWREERFRQEPFPSTMWP
jgi:hypothetical protein